jgi:hypothetical protein
LPVEKPVLENSIIPENDEAPGTEFTGYHHAESAEDITF